MNKQGEYFTTGIRRCLSSILAALVLVVGLGPSHPAPPEPYLVKDINTQSVGSLLSGLTNVNGTLFFSADDGSSGGELWKSDGTEAGTVRVKDIYPGGGGSYPEYLTAVNGTLFFSADDGSSGGELWKSDGTEAGTVRVKDINLGGDGSWPGSLTAVNGTLFFSADNGSSGRELWALATVYQVYLPLILK